MSVIDARAIIDPKADIDEDVDIGPYSIIGADVAIASGSQIGSHVVIKGPARIGKDNRIFQFASIGDDPQDKKYHPNDESRLVIGAGNVIREFCTIHRGTERGGGQTVIGDDNWIMAYVHIAHDCMVGSHTVFANNATLAGHVTIDDHVILGGFTGVHQFCRIGAYVISAIASVIIKDVPPYLRVSGNTAKPNGLNKEGFRRHGFSAEKIEDIKLGYKCVYRQGLLLKDALARIKPMTATSPAIQYFHDFIAASSRGIVR